MFFWIVIKASFCYLQDQIFGRKYIIFILNDFRLQKVKIPWHFVLVNVNCFLSSVLKMWRSRLQLFGVFKKCKLTKNNFLNDLISVWQYTLKNLNTNGVDFNINQTFFDLPLWKMEWVNLMDFIHPTAFPFILVKKSPFTGK